MLISYSVAHRARLTRPRFAALLRTGAALDARGWFGQIPLHLAAGIGTQQGIVMLTEAGSDVNVVDDFGGTPVQKAAAWGKPESIALHIKAGGFADARVRGGWCPLHLPAKHGSAENISALLGAGANPAIENADGKSAWDLVQGRKDIGGTEAYGRLNAHQPQFTPRLPLGGQAPRP